jgi:SAM-dependent methyltransferase
MHASVMAWATRRVAELDLSHGSVLEVGSWNCNGSVRPLFTGEYWGVDMIPNDGVDELVIPGGPLPGSDYDVVVCTEVLEHDERPWVTIAEMARVLKPGGHLLVTARGYDERGCYEVHGAPEDYWRFSTGSMRIMAQDAGLYLIEVEQDPEFPGVFLTAVKPGP